MILSKLPELISKTGRVSVYLLDCVRIQCRIHLKNLEWYLAHRNVLWPKATQLLPRNREILDCSDQSWGWVGWTLSPVLLPTPLTTTLSQVPPTQP